MAGVTPTPTQASSHVSATARAIPAGLVPVAVLLAAAVGLLSLLPSLAQAVWEVPHLFLLGLVISYGVFSQRNTDVDKTGGGGDGDDTKDGALAWNARYHPDDPLVMVADHAASDGGRESAMMERPLSLPVRRLKRPAAPESETGDASDGVGDEETDSSGSSPGFWPGSSAAPSPPSVLYADMGLSPCSQPQPPPFFVHSTNKSRRSDAAMQSAMPPGFPSNYPSVPREPSLSDDGEVTDWDEEADDGSDEMTVSSERSVRDDFTACANDHNDGDGDDDDMSVDEELLKLAMKAAPEGEDEVDRKADEFIAKFREQIMRQRV